MRHVVDRTKPPDARLAARFEPPPFAREMLECGLELVLAPRSGVPLVTAELLLPAGADRDSPARPGIAALTASLLDEGSTRRSGFELAEELERRGSALATYADWDAVRLEISALASHLDVSLAVVAEAAFSPAFPEHEVERLRRQTLTELERLPDRPARLADRELARSLYSGTPYGELLHGTVDSVSAITRDDLVAHHGRFCALDGAQLVVAGDFSPSEARSQLRRLFDRRTPPASEIRREAWPAARPYGARVTIVDIPTALQTELRIGHIGVPRAHQDRTRLGVLNSLLGGKFTSRLNLQLREKRGFTYGVSSRFVDRRHAGPFVIATSVGNDVTGAAVADSILELDRLRQEPVPVSELDETRSYLLGALPFSFQTLDGWAGRLADLVLHGLPDDHLERAIAEIESTTVDELLSLARRHLRPDDASIVAVGPAKTLGPQLERFGEIRRISPSAH